MDYGKLGPENFLAASILLLKVINRDTIALNNDLGNRPPKYNKLTFFKSFYKINTLRLLMPDFKPNYPRLVSHPLRSDVLGRRLIVEATEHSQGSNIIWIIFNFCWGKQLVAMIGWWNIDLN